MIECHPSTMYVSVAMAAGGGTWDEPTDAARSVARRRPAAGQLYDAGRMPVGLWTWRDLRGAAGNCMLLVRKSV